MLRILFILLLSTNVVAELDDPFVPFTYAVGESMIKSVIGGDANFPIQWTQSNLQTTSVIATGANVLSPLIDKFELLLKVAAQNSASGVTGTGTVVTTGSLSNALTAILLAQSGVALENILYLSSGISSDKPMLLLYPNQSNGVTNLLFFDILKKEIVSYSNQYRYRLVNISPTALSQDLERRINQTKARNNYGCQPYFGYLLLDYLNPNQINYYCVPNEALFDLYVKYYSTEKLKRLSLITSQVVDALNSFHTSFYYTTYTGLSRIETNHPVTPHFLDSTNTMRDYGYNKTKKCYFHDGDTYKDDCIFGDGVAQQVHYCVPSVSGACLSPMDITITPSSSNSSACPIGLSYSQSLFSPDNVLVCIIPSWNITDNIYNIAYRSLNIKPIFEAYPDFKFQLNPYIPKTDEMHISSMLDGSYLFYSAVDAQNQLISSAFALKLLSDGFILSKTLNGVKLNRQNSITAEVDLQIREIIKYDFNFNVIERNLSFWTGDGFDIDVQNSFLSPKTYGIAGKTIAAQLVIRTISSEMVLPEEKKEGDGGVVPCGLGKDVQVLKTRKNAEGKDENYFETQRSPPCTTNFGKAPNAKNIKDFKQLCPKEGEEGYNPECKESDFFKDSLKQLTTNISLDSDSFKISDITSDKCPLITLRFSEMPYIKGKDVYFNKHCDYFANNPTVEYSFRVISMIGWFIFALFKLFSA